MMRIRAESAEQAPRIVSEPTIMPGGKGPDGARAVTTEYFSLLVLATFSAYFSWFLLAEPFSDRLRLIASDLTTTFVPLLGGGLTVALFASGPRGERTPWLLLGLGTIVWGLGEAAWSFYEVVLDQPSPFPSFADVGYLGAVPLIYGALLLLPRQLSGARGVNRRLVFEAAAACLVILCVCWFLVLRPMYDDATQSILGRVVGLAYPTSDVLFLMMLAVGTLRGWLPKDRPVVGALALGILALVYADLGFALLELNGLYETGSFFDFGWPVGFLLLTHAAVAQRSALARAQGRSRM